MNQICPVCKVKGDALSETEVCEETATCDISLIEARVNSEFNICPEIEVQNKMLKSLLAEFFGIFSDDPGVTSALMNHLSSPNVLVKEADHSWHISIDFKALMGFDANGI